MAYDASNINENDQQVAGSTPLSQGGGTSPAAQGQDQGAPQGPSTPATIQAGQSSTQAAQSQQPKQSNKPASSGMFTNIQNYVQKNQPAAQKMAGAVSQNVGDQASEIRQVAEQKKAQTDAALAANQKNIDESRKWATTQIGNIMGTNQSTPPQQQPVAQNYGQDPKPISGVGQLPEQKQVITGTVDSTQPKQPFQMSEEDTKRMQDLAQGNLQGITQVGDLNLAQQQMRAQALQQLAQGANTEQGRQNLLRQTFQGQAPAAYTRGLSGLDQLVVSGDQAAREQLIQGTQQQAQGLGQELGSLQQQAASARMEQEQQLRNFGGDIQNLATSNITDLETGIDQSYEQALAERAALLDPESQQYKQAMEGIQSNLARVQGATGGWEGYANMLENLIPQAYSQAGVRKSDAASTNLEQYVQNMRDFAKTGQIVLRESDGFGTNSKTTTRILKGKEAEDYLNSGGGARVTHHKNRAAVNSLLNLVNQQLGLDSDLYGTNKFTGGMSQYGENNQRYLQSLGQIRDFYNKQFSGKTAEDIYNQRMQQLAGGASLEDFAAGKDISRLETASADNIARINALQSILGKQGYTPEMYTPNEFVQTSDISDVLSRYASGTTGPRTSK